MFLKKHVNVIMAMYKNDDYFDWLCAFFLFSLKAREKKFDCPLNLFCIVD